MCADFIQGLSLCPAPRPSAEHNQSHTAQFMGSLFSVGAESGAARANLHSTWKVVITPITQNTGQDSNP